MDSFLEKQQRKDYDQPLEEITDLAGVRVVCLYKSEVEIVAQIIRKDFEIIEDIDKQSGLGIDQFGYGARHFLVRLGKGSSGARYDDLKRLICEIQVRTVVQDAWAIIQHHMVYKREAQVPTQLQRKMNSLSGLFETVDDQFERIREERESYIAGVRGSAQKSNLFLENELNLDTFKEYLVWKFPGRAVESWDGQARLVLDAFIASGYKLLRDVDRVIEEMASTIEKLKPELTDVRPARDGTLPATLEPALALGLKEPDGAWIRRIASWKPIIKKFARATS